MFPYIIFLGKTITTYQLMALIGIFSAGIYSSLLSKKHLIDSNETIMFLLIASIGIFFGSHLLYILISIKTIKTSGSFNDFIKLFLSGSVFYGGLTGGIIIVYYFRERFKNFNKIVYIVTPSIPLFHFFGRIGCFLYGCCFGIECIHGYEYSISPVEIANGVKRLPIQLIEAIFNLTLFTVLHLIQKKYIFQLYLVFYSMGRFIIEYFRGDHYRGIWIFNFSTSQIISIIILFGTLLNIFYLKKHEKKQSSIFPVTITSKT